MVSIAGFVNQRFYLSGSPQQSRSTSQVSSANRRLCLSGNNNNAGDDFGLGEGSSNNNNNNNEFNFGPGSSSENIFDINIPSPTSVMPIQTLVASMLQNRLNNSITGLSNNQTSTSGHKSKEVNKKVKVKRNVKEDHLDEKTVRNSYDSDNDLEKAADETTYDFDPYSSYGMLNLDPRYQNPNQGVYTNHPDYRVH